jgi:hypothetical protein
VLDNAEEGSEVLITLSPVIDDVGVLFEDEIEEPEPDPEPGDGSEFGEFVSNQVKANGGPPPHANAKGLQE